MVDQFKMQLGVILDKTSLTAVEKELLLKNIKIPADLDLTKFVKSKNEISKLTAELGKEIQSILGKSVSSSQANGMAKSYVDSLITGAKQATKEYDNLARAAQKSADAIRQTNQSGTFDTQISKAQSDLQKYGLTAEEASGKLKGMKDALVEINASSNDNQALITAGEKIKLEYDKVKNVITQTRLEFDKLSVSIDTNRQTATIAKLNNYLSNNSAITKEAKAQIQQWIATLNGANVTVGTLKDINVQFVQLDANMRSIGRLGPSTLDSTKALTSKFTQWVSITGVVMTAARSGKQAVNELKEIDSILTEISKTSDLTTKQIKELGSVSFKSGSKFGKEASDYLLGVQEMSRSGFYGAKGTAMAEQSLLAQAAGDMSAELANKYILATNAAYNLNGEAEKLNEILDGQNAITNRNSVAMEDMAEIVSKAGSVAANYRVTIEQLSALGGTIEAVTKAGGDEVGTGIKSLLINLQNVSSSKITSTLDEANASMTKFVNGTEKLRTPIEILRDLSETFNSLDKDDPLKAEILTNIGGKYQANKLAAILSNMDMYDKMLQDYTEGSGSAMEEAMKSANNWEGSLNKLSNTWTSTVNNLVNSDGVIAGINALNNLLTVVEKLTSALGSLNTIGLAAGIFASAKNFGGTN